MALEAGLVSSVHLLLKGVPLPAARAAELARLLDNREELLAHLLVTENLLTEHPPLGAAVRAAARSVHTAPGERPAAPSGVPPISVAAFADLAQAQLALIEADMANHDALRALTLANARYRGLDEPLAFVAEPPSRSDAPGPRHLSRLRSLREGVGLRLRGFLGGRR